MSYLSDDFDECKRADPPWFTDLLSNLQKQEGFENLGLAGVDWNTAPRDLYLYRDEIIQRFNEYYALYEIGQETPQRFQFMCNRHFNARKKKWAYMIKLYTENLTEKLGRLNKTVKLSDIMKAITGTENETRNGTDSISGTHGNVQNYKTNRENKTYDTPVTSIQALNDGYLSGGSGEESDTGVTGTNTIEDVTQINRQGNKSTEKSDNTNENTSIEYSFYDKPIVELIEENIDVWNDVIQSIINDCKELFINVTARI